ncbi:MAG: type VI secretion system baseplate subunit TssG [Planctomycetes bacterium]|nr:type VI secretion system baseplate subunit TssG [Planctomycetota bacterium]
MSDISGSGQPRAEDGAAAGRSPDPPIIERLYAEPQRFELFQAVRLLFAAAVEETKASGGPAPPGIGSRESDAVRRPAVRFHSSPTLGFPQGAITAIRRESPTEAAARGGVRLAHVELACFGLIGPAGTLPRHYSSLVVERYRRFRDTALREFLDIFVQRMTALLCRAWAKYRPAVQHELTSFTGLGTAWDEAAEAPRDPVTATVASLVGLGVRGLPGRLVTGDDVVFRHAAHFSRQPRSAESLERLLRDVYQVPVRVEQFVGRWLELEEPDQTALASRDRPEGLNARLGIDAIAGQRVWDVESAFEVVLGPLNAVDFGSRLPGTARLAALGDLLRLYAGPQFEIRVRLVLSAAAVPRCQLGGDEQGMALSGSRLGWTTWLAGGPPHDRGDAVFAVG